MPQLNVKIDHVATLRGMRKTAYPEPTAAAVLAEMGGADRIYVHLWQDRRHVSDRDVRILRQTVQTNLVLEIGLDADLIGLALKLRPHRVNLVHEDRDAMTVDQGLDLLLQRDLVTDTVTAMKRSGIETCICIDPVPEQVKLAHKTDAAMVEIHTGSYCRADTTLKRNRAYLRILDAVNLAHKLKMTVGIGHGLCPNTVTAFRHLSTIDEITIGHSIVSRAILVGMEAAVRDMAHRIRQ